MHSKEFIYRDQSIYFFNWYLSAAIVKILPKELIDLVINFHSFYFFEHLIINPTGCVSIIKSSAGADLFARGSLFFN